MKRIKYKKNRKLQPNQLEYNGAFPKTPISMQLFLFDQQQYKEYTATQFNDIKNALQHSDQQQVKWFDLHGLHQIELLEEIGKYFQVESYIMSEILNFSRRTRVEEVDEVLFFSVKAIVPLSKEDQSLNVEQISFILKKNTLLCFQERPDCFFDVIRERIRQKIGQIRKKDASFLLYALLDVLMDSYLIALDSVEDKVELVLLEAKTNYHKSVLIKVEELTQELQDIKRASIPFREVLHNLQVHPLERQEVCGISRESGVFFNRLQYKCSEVLDQIEYNLNKLDSATNYYFASQSNRMNEIMKVLTIVSVVFIPLTFIAGIYGMNFENMPELGFAYGYYYTLLGMFVLLLGMLYYFKYKKWF